MDKIKKALSNLGEAVKQNDSEKIKWWIGCAIKELASIEESRVEQNISISGTTAKEAMERISDMFKITPEQIKKDFKNENEKYELGGKIIQAIDSLKTKKQIAALVEYWWSSEQVVNRIKEEMDQNWFNQTNIDDLEDQLKQIKLIAKGCSEKEKVEAGGRSTCFVSIATEETIEKIQQIGFKMCPLVEQLAELNAQSVHFRCGYSITKDIEK